MNAFAKATSSTFSEELEQVALNAQAQFESLKEDVEAIKREKKAEGSKYHKRKLNNKNKVAAAKPKDLEESIDGSDEGP